MGSKWTLDLSQLYTWQVNIIEINKRRVEQFDQKSRMTSFFQVPLQLLIVYTFDDNVSGL